MAKHFLPEDPSAWPRDPFQLLGVNRGANERELRKAYLDLIRKYKPEHAPEEFRRIREAYEAAKRSNTFSRYIVAWSDDDAGQADSPSNSVALRPRTDTDSAPTASSRSESPSEPDLWDSACEGNEAAVYRELLERLERGPGSEEVFLQLYWLLVTTPSLDGKTTPTEWLLQGLRVCGTPARRLRELLKREVVTDPESTLDERLLRFLSPDIPVELVVEAAHCRWRAARQLMRWSVIVDDVKVLRGWHTFFDVDVWIHLLLNAASNLAWAIEPVADGARFYRREAEQLAHEHSIDVDNELTELEYIESVVRGLSKFGSTATYKNELYQLLCHSWDDDGLAVHPRLMPYLRDLSRDPRSALARLDVLNSMSPAALGRLAELAGNRRHDRPDRAVVDEVEAFLAESRWWEYDVFRVKLLMFCAREMVSPQVIAQTLEDRPDFVLSGNRRLTDVIAVDWPMLLVFRACELSSE